MEVWIALIWTAGALGIGCILHLVALRFSPGKRDVQGDRKAADGNDGKGNVETQGGIRALPVG